MKRKKRRVAAAGVVLIVLSTAYIRSYQSVNSKWSDAPVESYSVGDCVAMEEDILMDGSMQGYSITVVESEVMEYLDYLEKYGGEDEYTYAPDKVYDVTILLKNEDAAEGTGINLWDFYIQGLAVYAGINTQLLDLSNPDLDGNIAIALRENSEMEIHLPFNLLETHFRENVWENLQEFPMQLIVTLYPVKKVVQLI